MFCINRLIKNNWDLIKGTWHRWYCADVITNGITCLLLKSERGPSCVLREQGCSSFKAVDDFVVMRAVGTCFRPGFHKRSMIFISCWSLYVDWWREDGI